MCSKISDLLKLADNLWENGEKQQTIEVIEKIYALYDHEDYEINQRNHQKIIKAAEIS
ncbi:hypothetical protein [Gluconobacter morbifer]|uniref:Uncharacterized protein n=1 Tax=Gluconobacter morbifer G707 TaxID=1088869 RepID=G6XHP5_9PROT|nr:hypothetical protein [Gluconobacter morbifer]EHH69703.1 hypothetical protein GMO_10110 [Gluconobacter morbifer G707]